jgi:hypothetical protein
MTLDNDNDIISNTWPNEDKNGARNTARSALIRPQQLAISRSATCTHGFIEMCYVRLGHPVCITRRHA